MIEEKKFSYDVVYRASHIRTDGPYKIDAFSSGFGLGLPGSILIPGGFQYGSFSSGFQVPVYSGLNLDPVTDDDLLLPNMEFVKITIQPQSKTPNAVQAILNLSSQHAYVNNKFTNTGELSIVLKNHLQEINFFIDELGYLIVSGDDAANYSIDSHGQLVYTNR